VGVCSVGQEPIAMELGLDMFRGGAIFGGGGELSAWCIGFLLRGHREGAETIEVWDG